MKHTPCFEDPDTWLSTSAKKIARAKEGCNACPIRVQCLQDCLDYEQLTGAPMLGVHGGLSVVERINHRERTATR